MSFFYEERDGVLLLRCRALCEAGVTHAFSTRIGGVSAGAFESLNLGLSRGDAPEAVEENYRRFLAAAGASGAVCRVKQVHGDLVHEAPCSGEAEPGVRYSHLFGGRPPKAGDGLMTDRTETPLMVYYADCMPVLLYDPVRRVCAAVHSGWRGTVLRIAAAAVRRMGERYGCRAQDLIAAVGPSAGPLRYEVSEEVAAQFEAGFGAESGVVVRSSEELVGRYPPVPTAPGETAGLEVLDEAVRRRCAGRSFAPGGADVMLLSGAGAQELDGLPGGHAAARVCQDRVMPTAGSTAKRCGSGERASAGGCAAVPDRSEDGTEARFFRAAPGSAARTADEAAGTSGEDASTGGAPAQASVRPGGVAAPAETGLFVRPHVDLWRAARLALLDAGVPEEKIHISGVCTVSEPTRYFSHRIMGENRGNGAAVIMLTEGERGC